MKTNIQFVVHIDVSLTEACVDMSKFTAPMAWKKTSPEQHKFRSQEKLRSKKPAVPVQELGELLVDEFSSGASSATRAPWLLFFVFFVHVTYVGVNRKDFKFQSDIYNIYMHIQIRDSFCQHAWVLVLLYPCEVQKTASSAVDWLAKQGGQAKPADFVCRLSKLATAGRNPQNAERDLHRLLHKVSLRFEADPEHVMVRMVNPWTLEVEPQLLPIFFPDTVLMALWQRGEDTFRSCLFGTMSERDVDNFWAHARRSCRWSKGLQSHNWPFQGKVASLGTYGDEIQTYKNAECGIVSVYGWSSEFGFANHAMLRYYPIALWSEHCESEFTFADIEAAMLDRWRNLTNPETVWPWSAAGYLLTFSFISGDLKWINERMGGIHNYRKNEFCSRCRCVKKDDDLFKTLPNMSDDPDAFEFRVYNNEELAGLSPLLGLPGMCLERVLHDVAHSQFLGTGKTTNGFLASLALFSKFLGADPTLAKMQACFPTLLCIAPMRRCPRLLGRIWCLGARVARPRQLCGPACTNPPPSPSWLLAFQKVNEAELQSAALHTGQSEPQGSNEPFASD